MVGLQLHDMLQRLHPLFPALVGQAEHQVDGHVLEPGPASLCHSHLGMLVGVGTAQRLQLGIVIALDADGDAVETGSAQLGKALCGDGIGVGFEGDLRVLFQLEAAVNLRQNADQTLCAEEAGRTAAEIDGIHHITHHTLAGLLDMGQDCLQVQIHGFVVQAAAQRVEIAVFTLAAAERHMDIQAQGLQLHRGFFLFFDHLKHRKVSLCNTGTKPPLRKGRWPEGPEGSHMAADACTRPLSQLR